MPYLSTAAKVSPPPAMENAGLLAIAKDSVLCAFAKLVKLKNADRAIPNNGAHAQQEFCQGGGGVGTDIKNHIVFGDIVH